ALNGSIANSHAAFGEAQDIARFGQINAAVDRKMTAFRNWIVTREESSLDALEEARQDLRRGLEGLLASPAGTERQQLRQILKAEEDPELALRGAVAKRRAGGDDEAVRQVVRTTVEPKRVDLERKLHGYLDAKERLVGSLERSARLANRSALAALALIA